VFSFSLSDATLITMSFYSVEGISTLPGQLVHFKFEFSLSKSTLAGSLMVAMSFQVVKVK
jgi:hypothetical protein